LRSLCFRSCCSESFRWQGWCLWRPEVDISALLWAALCWQWSFRTSCRTMSAVKCYKTGIL